MTDVDQKLIANRGRDLAVGGDLVFLGTPHRITRFTNYDPTLMGLAPEPGWRIAHAGLGWGMTISPNGTYEVLP